MKSMLKLSIVSALLITNGALFAVSYNENSNGTSEQQATVEEDSYSRVDNKTLKKANETLQKSVVALDNIMEDPEESIPPYLISQSEGIVIFPRALKIAVGVAGGQGARGIAMIHNEDGSWSNPFFVSLGEGSLGIQFGVQKSDIVLLFKDKNVILGIEEAEITLGSDVGVTAGPASNGSISTTDLKFESEIYSYCRSKGLFAGISLKGGILAYNNSVNESMYGMNEVKTEDILNTLKTPYNDHVDYLMEAVAMYEE